MEKIMKLFFIKICLLEVLNINKIEVMDSLGDMVNCGEVCWCF